MQAGLIDGLGGQTDAIRKAASLAGVANYELMDVNTEVSRAFNKKLERINSPIQFESNFSGGFSAADIFALLNSQGADAPTESSTLLKDLISDDLDALLTLFLAVVSAQTQPRPCPTFP